MMKQFYVGAIALLFIGAVLVPNANAEITTTSTMLDQIKALMAKVEELQKQLATIQGEIKAVLKDGLSEGATDEDIKKIQEILATDSTIYPEGKVTGYFGPLTKEAVKRFQKRHELEVTGVIDEATHDLLEEYLKERFGEQIPPGLLRAPGIAKKIELRIKEGCDNSGEGNAPFCKKLKIKYGDDELEDEDEDSDEDEDEDEDEDTVTGTTTPVTTQTGSTTTSTSITKSTVATHNVATSCWLIISGKVYDATQYIPYHPGGKSAISNRCGTDATAAFTSNSNGGRKHSASATNALAKYFVGTLAI